MSLFLSISSFFNVDEKSGSWCLIPAQWSTSKFNCSSRSRHLASLTEVSAELRNYFKGFRSVQVLRQLCLRCRTKHGTAYTTAWHSLSVAAIFWSALVSVYDQYRTRPEMLFSCCCSKNYFICESHTSAWTLYGPATHGTTNIVGFSTSVLASLVHFFDRIERRNNLGYSFCNFFFNCASILEKSETKFRTILQGPTKIDNYVWAVRFFN